MYLASGQISTVNTYFPYIYYYKALFPPLLLVITLRPSSSLSHPFHAAHKGGARPGCSPPPHSASRSERARQRAAGRVSSRA
eukprot:scaffold18279_cov35-Tisochrysis_lutea.AAC.3